MKESLLLALLAVAIYFHFQNPAPGVPSKTQTTQLARRSASPVVLERHREVAISTTSSYNRWKTGPNAQTEFEPFAPNEQAHWNQSCGYTIMRPMR